MELLLKVLVGVEVGNGGAAVRVVRFKMMAVSGGYGWWEMKRGAVAL